jgi:hypothetical protein
VNRNSGILEKAKTICPPTFSGVGMKNLHWLPVEYRIQYHILIYVYKCLYGLAPSFLTELLSVKQCQLMTRSSSQVILSQPIGCTKTFEQGFQFAGPASLNKLPSKIRHSNNINNFKNSWSHISSQEPMEKTMPFEQLRKRYIKAHWLIGM